MIPTLNDVINHARHREYMTGVERDAHRIKATGEVFTPTALVQEALDKLPQTLFSDPSKTFIDPSCGDGQFLSEVLIRKIAAGVDFETALSTIYGVDIMIDNVDACRERLLCGQEHLRPIVEKNIQCKNSVKYGYKFEPMGSARTRTEQAMRKKQQKYLIKQHKQQQEKRLFGQVLD
jgi:hypothetical protein